MAGFLRDRTGKAALIALILLTLSLAPTVAIQPDGRSPDSGPPEGYAGLRPDWVRVPPLLRVERTRPPSAIWPAPATPTERPLPAPTPVEPLPTAEAPAPTETITIAGVLTPVEASPSPTALPPTESPAPTESPLPPTAPPPTESPAPSTAPEITEGPDPAFAEAIVELTNEVRVANGLTPLAEHPSLVAAAQKYAGLHAQVSPDRLDHHLNGSALDSRAEAEGYAGWTFLAENLVWGSVDLSPAEAVQQWLASPGHRDNMLNPTLNEIGVGCYVSAAERPFRICVQDFGTRQ